MEKYHDTVSKDYFRSSNHRGVSALKQHFLKKHRIPLLEAAGLERVKESYNFVQLLAYHQNMYYKMQQM